MRNLLFILLFFSCFGSYGTSLKEDFDKFESAIEYAQEELYEELRIEFFDIIQDKLNAESLFQKADFASFKRSVNNKFDNLEEENEKLKELLQQCNQSGSWGGPGAQGAGYMSPQGGPGAQGGSAGYMSPQGGPGAQGDSGLEGQFEDFTKNLDYELKSQAHELAEQFKALIQEQLRKELAKEAGFASFREYANRKFNELKKENEELQEQLEQCNQPGGGPGPQGEMVL